MADIWKDRFFNMARSKAERLLLAGIDYSEERLVAYIAAKPPRSYCHTFAHNQGRKIIYLPWASSLLSCLTKIRFFPCPGKSGSAPSRPFLCSVKERGRWIIYQKEGDF